MSLIADSIRVSWIDMCFIKGNIPTILVTCLVAPLLYLFAFGYGLGQGMTVDGFPYIAFMIPGVMALTALTSSFNTVATKVMVQRVYYQSFDELILCSMSPTAIVLGKAYAGAVRGVISCLILYVLGLVICPEMCKRRRSDGPPCRAETARGTQQRNSNRDRGTDRTHQCAQSPQ